MRLRLALGLSKPAPSGVAAFNPTSLSPAIWFDPSDLTTLFQDTAGTTPVTTDGQTVKRMNNKGSLGGSMQDAVGMTYRLSAGLSWLQGNGTTQRLISAATMDLSAFSHLGFTFAATPQSAANMFPYQLGNQAGGCFDIRMNNTTFNTYTPANDSLSATASSWGSGVKSVTTVQDWDITQAAASSKMPFRINATVPAKSVGTDAGTTGTVFANATLYLSYTPTFASYATLDHYGLIIKGSAFSAGELANVETWLGAKCGLTL